MFYLHIHTSAKFWLVLQDDYDIEEEKIAKKAELDTIQPMNTDAA